MVTYSTSLRYAPGTLASIYVRMPRVWSMTPSGGGRCGDPRLTNRTTLFSAYAKSFRYSLPSHPPAECANRVIFGALDDEDEDDKDDEDDEDEDEDDEDEDETSADTGDCARTASMAASIFFKYQSTVGLGESVPFQ